MWVSLDNFSIVPWILFAQMSPDMSAVPAITATPPSSPVVVEVRDRAGVFSHGAGATGEGGFEAEVARSPHPGPHRDEPVPRESTSWWPGGSGTSRWSSAVTRRTEAHPMRIGPPSARRFSGRSGLTTPTGGSNRASRRSVLRLPPAAKPNSGAWGALISVTALLGLLVVVLATRTSQATEARADLAEGPHHPPRPAEERCYRVELTADQVGLWTGFNAFVPAMLAIDLRDFHRRARGISKPFDPTSGVLAGEFSTAR